MNENYMYALAGLLHDIGKFGQRADVSLKQTVELNEQSKKMIDQVCNLSKNGYYTHQHVLWTNNFLESHKALFVNAGLYGEGENNMFNMAVFHHKPKTMEHAIITMADHWSSGIDRNTDKVLERNETYGRDAFRSIPLVSIFNELSTKEKPNGIENEKFGYRLQKNGITEKIFPAPSSAIDLRQEYASLWKSFNEEVTKLKTTDARNLIFTLYHLLKVYTWYIPASTMDYPDSSLFEHLKTTGAFAQCIAAWIKEHPNSFTYENGRRIQLKENSYPVLMVCGDISGIQSFIYNISNKSAMKGLKGRSFYVQLLSETLSDELLEACNTSIVNQVYAAGGKFYLLLPNTNAIKKAIQDYERAIQLKLWTEFAGKITVNIGSIEFGMQLVEKELKAVIPDKNTPVSIGELWGLLSEKTSLKKKTKFNHIIEANFEGMFRPFGSGGDVQVCAVTGEELQKGKAVNLDKKFREQTDDAIENVIVSEVVNKQIEIGSKLYDTKYLIKLPRDSSKGYLTGLHTKWEFENATEHVHSVQQWINVWFKENPELFPDKSIEKEAGLGFKFYGGIPMVSRGKKVATLEEICLSSNQLSETSNEIEKLGILRMDVDNLGQLFMNGFKSGSSFSKLTTLSALLEQFFSGYLNTIKSKDKFKEHINIIYSGGDDVFALGRWDLLIEFAIEINLQFKKFVCNRTDITISAGIVIVDAKFPIAKAADAAGEAESLAKNYKYAGKEKNAITIFGIPVNWDLEMPFIESCKNDLVQWIAKDAYMSKGFLMKMFDYYKIYLKKIPDWQWQATYSVARYAKEAKNDILQREAYNSIKNLLFSRNYKNQFHGISFDAFIVACRWSELILKQLNK